ncbi:MAG: nicotinate (nicotinamide) nucleotide adenylyltransferase [Oligoflexia bacterium]|nr:nicotinate (nicotinamide) nucleotide adenylyltransferase [Oligoflexia bacterium]
MTLAEKGGPRWHEVTAVFGGTFDPPHCGHLEAVRGLFRVPGVQRTLVIPSATPPQKPGFAPTEHRLEMTRRCFAPLAPDVTVDFREAERAVRNPERPSYTFDTLLELRRDLPRLAFVLGADQLARLPSWHRFPEILGLCHWIVLERKPDGGALAAPVLRQWLASGLLRPDFTTREGTTLQLFPTEAPLISSTAIRQQLARAGEPPNNLLPPEVVIYLKMHRLYGTSAVS